MKPASLGTTILTVAGCVLVACTATDVPERPPKNLKPIEQTTVTSTPRNGPPQRDESGSVPTQITDVSPRGNRAQGKVDPSSELMHPRRDFVQVFQSISPSVVGVAAGSVADGKFVLQRGGTGFVWDDAGHIVTNAHQVAEAQEVRVRSKSGTVKRARIVGLDLSTDLAVIKADGLGLTPVKRGQYSSVMPGQWVAAIGNPHGLQHSITVGVVSAVGRKNVSGTARYADFIQSDVSIFRGNSGGPLVNMNGEVIGLNTAKLGEGLSLSTRIDMVEMVTHRLVREGKFERGFAGLFVGHVSSKAAESAGLATKNGARVRGLVADGPAASSGLRPGDIILRYGEQKIVGADSLPWLIAATRPSTMVKVEVARGTERLLVQLTLGSLPELGDSDD